MTAGATPADRARTERTVQGLGPTVTDPLAYRDLHVLRRQPPSSAQSSDTAPAPSGVLVSPSDVGGADAA